MTDEGRPKTPAAITTECALIIEQHLNVEFYRESRAKFLSVCDDYALCMLVSKDHGGKYWFGIFDHQVEWFESQNIPNQYFALACGGSDLIFLFSPKIFESWKDHLSSRYLPDRDNTYWHINIKKIDNVWKMQTKIAYDTTQAGLIAPLPEGFRPVEKENHTVFVQARNENHLFLTTSKCICIGPRS